MKRKYGWKRDHADPRDLMYKVVKPTPVKTILLADSCKMPRIYDQGQEGSCTANGWVACGLYLFLNGYIKAPAGWNAFDLSRAFQYATERIMDKTFPDDAGSSIRTGADRFHNLGICRDKTFPYTDKECYKKPTPGAYTEALGFKLDNYQTLNNTNLSELLNCLENKMPIVFGMNVYKDFESAKVAKSGIVPMPKGQVIGGHCMMIVGYKADVDRFVVQNSWGEDWGLKGYCEIPSAYLTNLKYASDFRTPLINQAA